jgi:HK97 family phage portal protein
MGFIKRVKDASNYVFQRDKGFTNPEVLKVDNVTSFGLFSDRNDLLENIYNTFSDTISLLEMQHIQWDNKEHSSYTFDQETDINYVLRISANKLQTPTEFTHTLAYQAIKYGNAIAIPFYGTEYEETTRIIGGVEYILTSSIETRLLGLEILDMESYQFGFGYEDIDGERYLVIKDIKNPSILKLIKYDSVIHIRYSPSNIFKGDKFIQNDNKIPNLLDAKLNSLITELSTNGKISGILKLKSGVGAEDLKGAKLNAFLNTFVRGNASGLAVLDSNEEFQSLNREFRSVSNDDIKLLRDNIYSMHRINENIINGTYDYVEYEAFYNSMIEPFVKRMEEEFNRKLFTKSDLIKGHRIIFIKTLLIGASLKDQAQFLREMRQLNVMTTNETRRLINLNPIEGGDSLFSETQMGQGTQLIQDSEDSSGGENGQKT